MKMSDAEFNKFQEITESAFGVKILLGILEEHPSHIGDDEIKTLATTLKKTIEPVVEYLQQEIKKQIDGDAIRF